MKIYLKPKYKLFPYIWKDIFIEFEEGDVLTNNRDQYLLDLGDGVGLSVNDSVLDFTDNSISCNKPCNIK